MRRLRSLLIRVPRRRRGAALIIALALTLCLTMVIVGTQLQVVTQLKGVKGQRDYDRALQLAEAGANAYLNFISNNVHSPLTPWDIASPPLITSPPSLAQVRSDILAGNIRVGKRNNVVNGVPYNSSMGLVPYPSTGDITSGSNPSNPSTNSQFGYFVILTKSTTAASVNMMSYGYSNGIVRRVQVGGSSSDIFDWAALWGVKPGDGWNVSGSLTVVGGFGGQGVMSYSNNIKFYDGPAIAAGPNASWNGTPSPPTMYAVSSPGNPTGHIGNGTAATPFVRTISRSLYFPTVDVDAYNYSAGAGSKAEYFRTHNHNLTGIRYLVWDGANASTITELTVGFRQGDVTSQKTNGNNTYVINVTGKNTGDPVGYTVSGYLNNSSTNNKTITNVPAGTTGIADTYKLESNAELTMPPDFALLVSNQGLNTSTYNKLYGLRIYPGTYFFENISMSSADIINIRSYNNADRSSLPSTSTLDPSNYIGYRPSNDPVNPNSGVDDGTANARREVRVYIGHSAKNTNGTQDVLSTFTNGMNMEYYRYPSRFRVFISTLTTGSGNSAISVGGSSNGNLPAAFNVNMLVYNQESNVNSNLEYGYIKFSSGVYLRGSLIAWHVEGAGGNTVEKATDEVSGNSGTGSGSSDRLTYVATAWKELP